MTDVFVRSGPHDPRVVLSEEGLLAEFNRAGVITAGDVHVARALGEVGRETDPDVLLAVALTCRAVRSGSVCLELATVADDLLGAGLPTVDPDGGEGPTVHPYAALPWPEPTAWGEAVARSPLVGLGVLRWSGGLLYLDRYHEQETQVLEDLVARAASTPPHDLELMRASLGRVFPDAGYEEQRQACLQAATRWTTVVTGGPGTGKTTAVAGLLVALHEQYEAQGRRVRVAMAAPTGKAAARLQEAVRDSAAGFADPADRTRLDGLQASTLHRLLGRHPGSSTRFRHHRGNRLPHDVVVVDETSMVSLTMMARLLEAVRPDARLVLVGDPDQLSSVDAGAVLGDLVEGYRGRSDSPVAALTTSHRFHGGISRLAEALRSDDVDRVLEVLAGGHPEVEWVRDGDPATTLRTVTVDVALRARDHARRGDGAGAIRALSAHRLLCAHRDGPFGVTHWNRRIEQWLSSVVGDPLVESHYVGRPLLVTSNDYTLGIYNGDSGVVVDVDGQRRVVIDTSEGLRDFAPSRMDDVETMHAMTIHKAQGSQAEEVTVLLPPEDSRLLTRELFYTAVTRAQTKVRVIGSEAEVRAAVERTAQRASGLAVRLRTEAPGNE